MQNGRWAFIANCARNDLVQQELIEAAAAAEAAAASGQHLVTNNDLAVWPAVCSAAALRVYFFLINYFF